jgi:hypothetical protein
MHRTLATIRELEGGIATSRPSATRGVRANHFVRNEAVEGSTALDVHPKGLVSSNQHGYGSNFEAPLGIQK